MDHWFADASDLNATHLKVFCFSTHGFTWVPWQRGTEGLKVEQSSFSKPSGDKPPHLSLSVSIPHIFCVCVYAADHSEVDPPHLSVTCLNETACGRRRVEVLTEARPGSLCVCRYVRGLGALAEANL